MATAAGVGEARLDELRATAAEMRRLIVKVIIRRRPATWAVASRPRTSWWPSTSTCCASIRGGRIGRNGIALSSPRAIPVLPLHRASPTRLPPARGVDTFDPIDSRLQGHPDLTAMPGLEMSTGSLGQGLSPGVGIAIGAKRRGLDFRTYVMVGDGECKRVRSGKLLSWHRAMSLDNLVVIVDHNRLPQYSWPNAGGEGWRCSSRSFGPLAGFWLAGARGGRP